MRPTFETIRPCDGSYTCSGTSHLSSCILALPHERNGAGFDPWDPDGDSPTVGPRLTRNAEGALRDWADRAEDYLAQENPPLPDPLDLPVPPTGPEEDKAQQDLRVAGIRVAEARVALRIVKTREELDSLRPGAVILDGDPAGAPDALTLLTDFFGKRTFWGAPNYEEEFGSDYVDLPAVVLYEPEGETR